MTIQEVISTLKQDYALRDLLEQKNLTVQEELLEEIDDLEQSLVSSYILPELKKCAQTLLADLQCDVYFSVLKRPNRDVVVLDEYGVGERKKTRVSDTEEGTAGTVGEDVPVTEDPMSENPTQPTNQSTSDGGKKDSAHHPIRRASSVGFSVCFPDGTVIHEKKAVKTFIAALRKIGLERVQYLGIMHAGQNLVSDTKRADSSTSQKLVDGKYVYTQMSNEDKKDDLRQISNMYQLNLILIDVEGKADGGTCEKETVCGGIVGSPENVSMLVNNTDFLQFMKKSVSEITAKNYMNVLDKHVRPFIHQHIDANADSVWSFTTADEVKKLIERLQEIPEFVERNKFKHNSMTAALRQYLEFVKSSH